MLAVVVTGVGALLVPATTATSAAYSVHVAVGRSGTAAADRVNGRLVGFNWRVGGAAVSPLHPRVMRSFALRLGSISPAPGAYDFSASDAEIDDVEHTGATPMLVIIERPAWAGGDIGAYRHVMDAVLRHYVMDRVAAGHRLPWFESGNEPEFPPTSHGQLPTQFADEVAAQAAAVAAIEISGRLHLTYGGPGALFADPVIVAAFVAAARDAGRLPDFVSWHSYANAPLLGPDGPEDTSTPAAIAVWQADHGVNPAASPTVLGAGAGVIRASVLAGLHPGEQMPRLLVTEWNLSSGGLDRRHDSFVGASHALASLVEMQRNGVDGATFFSSVDRHCGTPTAPVDAEGFCGDWGTASADGHRKPVWNGFAWWDTLAGGRLLASSGDDPASGWWAMSARVGGGVRVLLTSFSASAPRDRTIVIHLDGCAGGAGASATALRLDARHAGSEAPERLGPVGKGVLTVLLPANGSALITITGCGNPPTFA